MELSRRRALYPHVLGDRHPGSGNGHDERGPLPGDDRSQGHHSLPADQGRPALGRAFRQVGGPQRAHAGRLRDRLGPDHAVPGGLTGRRRGLRVGRDGRVPGQAREARALRNRRSRSPGRRRDRHRGAYQRRPRYVRARGPVRRIHRLRVRSSNAPPDHENQLHHAPARSDLLRLAGRARFPAPTARTA